MVCVAEACLESSTGISRSIVSVGCVEANPRPKPYRVSGAAMIQSFVSGPISRTKLRTPTASKPSPMSTVPDAPYRAAT